MREGFAEAANGEENKDVILALNIKLSKIGWIAVLLLLFLSGEMCT